MHKLRNLIEALTYEELQKLKGDLDIGAPELHKILHEKIFQRQREHGNFCATCFADIDPRKESSFTLVFGPSDLRQKASFCAVDCLEYFLAGLKKDVF